ncbi:MAG: cation diffusion facilitator family transporter, partial [Polyangia bacterium]
MLVALALIGGLMAAEVAVGLIAGSVALLTDAGHMLTDAGALALGLVALRLAARPPSGAMTYGLKRAEPLSAAINGAVLAVLAIVFVVEAISRLVSPHHVHAVPVLVVALVAIPVNVAAVRALGRANRESVNIEGAFQHILTDLYAFIATAIAAIVILTTGFDRADAIAALLVAGLMLRAAYGLLRDSGRIFFEAAPAGLD